MRRKPGALVPLEEAICLAAAALDGAFHGYELARSLAEHADHKALTGYGTLYRALGRLESMGLLTSEWESPDVAARESRPGRRLYTLTAEGARSASSLTHARQAKPQKATRRRLAPA